MRCEHGHPGCAYSDGGPCWAHVLHPSPARRARQLLLATARGIGTVVTYAFYWVCLAAGFAVIPWLLTHW